ncbi:hypothetical protein [Lysobacter fragariae]
MLNIPMLSTIKSHGRAGALSLALALATLSGGAAAQDLTVGWNPRSGDVWVDTWAGDMNRYGSRYRDPFIDEMVRYHSAPRPLVVELLDRRMAPGDIYLACSIASIIGRPCRYVVDEWDRDRGQGWGVIAKRMGIKPGSAEFHRLKAGFVPTYDRWARPIDLDDELHRVYPNRPQHGNAGKSDHGKSGKSAKGNKGGGAASGHGSKGGNHGGGSTKGHGGGDHGQGSGQGGGKSGQKKGGGKGHGKG